MNDKKITSANDFQYEKNEFRVLIKNYLGSDSIVTIPSVIDELPVTEIAASAFDSCEDLITIEFPNSLLKIGDNAFSNCTSLEEIKLPDSLAEIGSGAFSYCENLLKVKLSKSLVKIGDNAFEGCDSLTSIRFPESLQFIGSGVLSDCYSLANVYIPKSLKHVTGMENLVEEIREENEECRIRYLTTKSNLT